LYTVASTSATGDAWAAGLGGTLVRLRGAAWHDSPSTTAVGLGAVALASATEGWAVGGSSLWHLHDGQWTAAGPPTSSFGIPEPEIALNGIALSGPNQGWAVGGVSAQPSGFSVDGQLFHLDNGVWSEVPSPTQHPLRAVALASSSEGWAVGDHGTILHLARGVWSVATSPLPVDLQTIALVSPTEGWASGNSQALGTRLLHLHKGVWTAAPDTPLPIIESLALASATEGWAVGSGAVLRLHNGVWRAVAIPSSLAWLWGVALVTPAEGWAVGVGSPTSHAGCVLLHLVDGEAHVAACPIDSPLLAVAFASPSDGWAVGADGARAHYGGIVSEKTNGI
jgi:hypothetical protein